MVITRTKKLTSTAPPQVSRLGAGRVLPMSRPSASGTSQLATIMVNEYRVAKWVWERETEQFMCWGERQFWRGKSGEEQAEVHALSCLPAQGHSDIWASTVSKGHYLVLDPEAAIGVCVDICGYCYHQGPCGHLESGPLPVTKSMSRYAPPIGAMPIQGHGDIWPTLLPGEY